MEDSRKHICLNGIELETCIENDGNSMDFVTLRVRLESGRTLTSFMMSEKQIGHLIDDLFRKYKILVEFNK